MSANANGNNGSGKITGAHAYSALLIVLGGAAAILPMRYEIDSLRQDVRELRGYLEWRRAHDKEHDRIERNLAKLESNDSDLSRALFDLQLSGAAKPVQVREMERKPKEE